MVATAADPRTLERVFLVKGVLSLAWDKQANSKNACWGSYKQKSKTAKSWLAISVAMPRYEQSKQCDLKEN